MQVHFWFAPFFPSLLKTNIFLHSLYVLSSYFNNNCRCWVWKTSSKGYAAASLDGPNFKCIRRCCSRWPICWGASSWCDKGDCLFLIIKNSNITWLFLFYGFWACLLLCNGFLFNQGAAIDRILGEIVHSKSMTTPIDYVLCIGHFLGKVSFSSSLMYASGVYFVLEASCLICAVLLPAI